MLKAGWGVQLWFHGGGPEVPAFAGSMMLTTSKGSKLEITVEVAEQPSVPSARVTMPRYVDADSATLLFTAASALADADQLAGGTWVTIVAAREYSLGQPLEADFCADPDTYLGAVDAALAPQLREELRDYSDLVAGLVSGAVPSIAPELWQELAVYWFSDTHLKARGTSSASRVLQRTTLRAQEVWSAAQKLAYLIPEPQSVSRVIRIASRWLLVGHSQVIGSKEAFIAFFQCLEALTLLAEQAPDPNTESVFQALLHEVNSSADKRLLPFVLSLKERSSRPSLPERFRRLATTVTPASATADAEAFRAMCRVRNDLLHARVTDVPAICRGYPVEETIRRLAAEYLRAVVDSLQTRNEGKSEVLSRPVGGSSADLPAG